jgi:hypothetical protein
VSLKHQDAGKSAHPINVGEARWSSGCCGHGSPREFGIGSIRQRSESVDRNSSNRKTRCLRRANGLSDASRTCKRRLGSIRDGVHAVLSMCVEGKEPGDQVFTREDGKLIGDCRKTWYKMCCNVGLGRMACRVCDRTVTGDNCECGRSSLHYVGLLIHDLRRTKCRNLRRLGVDEKTIMKIGGWKTRSVFDRYNIVNERDLAEAAAKLDQKAQQRKLRHSSGTVPSKSSMKDESSSVN